MTSRNAFAWSICALSVVVGGCVRDETLRESRRLATARGNVTIDSIPALEFGRGGSAELDGFDDPKAGTRLSNGSVVVGDLKDNTIRYFDKSGRLVATFGGSGGGDDGFRAVAWLGQCAVDSVFVWDPVKERIVVLDRDAHYAREFKEPAGAAAIKCGRSQILAVLTSPQRPEQPSKTGTSPRQFVDLRFVNTKGDTLRSIPGILWPENRPLGRGTFLSVVGERVYVGTADSAPVAIYTVKGERSGSIPVSTGPARPANSLQYQEAVNDLVVGLTSEDDRKRARDYLLAIPMPKFLPAYSGLFATDSGTLWENVSALGDSGTVLRAIDRNGHPTAEVFIPVSLRVLEIGTDYILGAYRTKPGGARIVLYRLAGTDAPIGAD